jgi:trehalose 6-phosphate phosphatase
MSEKDAANGMNARGADEGAAASAAAPVADALDVELLAALDRLAAAPRLLVAVDFDGTLAPEVDDPERARALPEAHEAMLGLRRLPGTIVALVSGRALASLEHVGQLPGDTPLVGSHGLELRLAQGNEQPVLDAAARERLEALDALLAPLVDAVPGAWIERKPAGFAVHTRVVADPSTAAGLQRRLREEASRDDGGRAQPLTIRDGKNVIEFAVRDATKGDGLRALVERFAPDAVLFAGDDVTDEDALAVLGPDDLGIKVGEAESVARARVADVGAMAVALEHLLRSRERFSGDAR